MGSIGASTEALHEISLQEGPLDPLPSKIGLNHICKSMHRRHVTVYCFMKFYWKREFVKE